MEQLKVLYVLDSNPPFESVKLLQRSVSAALNNSRVALTEVRAGDKTSEEYAQILQNVDVIVGYDKRLLETRKSQGIGIPAVFPSYGLGTRGLLTLWENREFLSKGDSYLCPSSRDLLAASTHFRAMDQIGLYLLPYPIDSKYFEGAKVTRPEVLESLGIHDQPDWRWLFYSGRLNQQKNIHLLFNMVHELAKTSKDPVHLLVAGSEDRSGFPEMQWDNSGYEKTLEDKIQKLSVGGIVHMVGDIDPITMRSIYPTMDLHVTCSTFRTEDFGFAPVEAMAAGVPTIGTAWGGFWDTIEEDVTGYRMPVYVTETGLRIDWREGVAKAQRVLEDRFLRDRLSANCQKVAEAKYRPELFSQRLINILLRISQNKGSEFSGIDLQKLCDPPTLDFFRDLENVVAKGLNIFQAREKQFMGNNNERFRVFFEPYGQAFPNHWSVEDAPYIPLDFILEDGVIRLIDRNWQSSVTLNKTQQRLVREADGQRNVMELGKVTGLSVDRITVELQKLGQRGVVIPFSAK